MNATQIPRDARVVAADGAVGRVEHVVVDDDTQALTHLVVRRDGDGDARLLPVAAIDRLDGDQVVLTGVRAQLDAAPRYEASEFHAVDYGTLKPEDLPYQLQLREERLRVDTEETQAGVVRARTRVTERIETVNMPIREERLVIEVVPGTGRVRIGDRELQEGETIEVPLREERVVVGKEVVVHEDVVIRTESIERTESVQATLRREELSVEDPADLVVEPDAATNTNGTNRPRKGGKQPARR
jgi:uncharacterized protein (TIGR02271 family)